MMKTWMDAVTFLREEGFKEDTIVTLLNEIRALKIHHQNEVSDALFGYLNEVVVSDVTELKTPFNLYIRPIKKCAHAVKNILYVFLEEKDVSKKKNEFMIFSDDEKQCTESLTKDFLHAFHVRFTNKKSEAHARIFFKEHTPVYDGANYLVSHEHDSVPEDEKKFFNEIKSELMIVASQDSSVGSRMRLSVETGVPLLCEIFEENSFLDKFYFSDQLIYELSERGTNTNLKRVI